MLDSIIRENFLSSEEIELISNHIYQNTTPWESRDKDVPERLAGYYHVWPFYKKEFSFIRDMIESKLKNIIPIKLIMDHSHILESLLPYDVHTDYKQSRMFNGLTPAYTIIIPLETYNSRTIAFNQHYANEKRMEDVLLAEELPLVDDCIDDAFYEKYMTHVNPDYKKYLSVKEIFPWKQGSIHLCDRRYFHCSDNYLKNGIEKKRAIIFWTSVTT
jgi:hypothetical protein